MSDSRRLFAFAVILCCFLFSCNRNTFDYTIVDIKLAHYDNSGLYLTPAGSSVRDSAYVLRINYISDQTSYSAVDNSYSYDGLNRPTSIEITSLQTFDSLHPANSLLNDVFIAGPGIGSTVDDIVTGFLNTTVYYPTHDPDDLWLMKTPAAPGAYTFVVKMVFDDGRIATDTSTAINLVP